jgi:hypothetical protein
MRRKRVPIFAEVVIECAAVAIARWLKEQVALREDAARGSFARGGGVAGLVIFHDPDAIR